jgi:hypothetical protein
LKRNRSYWEMEAAQARKAEKFLVGAASFQSSSVPAAPGLVRPPMTCADPPTPPPPPRTPPHTHTRTHTHTHTHTTHSHYDAYFIATMCRALSTTTVPAKGLGQLLSSTALSIPMGPSRQLHLPRRLRVRCAFSDRHLQSRMPLVPTPARLKLVHACGQWYSSRVFIPLLPVGTGNCVQTLKVHGW